MKSVSTTTKYILWSLKKKRLLTFFVMIAGMMTGFYSNINAHLIKQLLNALSHKVPLTNLLILFAGNHLLHNGFWRVIHHARVKVFPILQTKLFQDIYQTHFHQPFPCSHAVPEQLMQVNHRLEHLIFFPLVLVMRSISLIYGACLNLSHVSWEFPSLLGIWLVVFVLYELITMNKKHRDTQTAHQARAQFVNQLTDTFQKRMSVYYHHTSTYEYPRQERALNQLQMTRRKQEEFKNICHLIASFTITVLLFCTLTMCDTINLVSNLQAGDYALIITVTFFITDNTLWVRDQITDIITSLQQTEMSLSTLLAKDTQHMRGSCIDLASIIDPYHTPMQRYALIGPSGSGKTTAAFQLMAQAKHWNVQYCGHDEALFRASLWYNITMGRPCSKQHLEDALRLSLSIDIAHKHTKGLDAIVGEDVHLSSGQTARILIARSLITHPDVIIYDEILSHIDDSRANILWQNILTYHRHTALIWISHDKRFLPLMDQVITLEPAHESFEVSAYT